MPYITKDKALTVNDQTWWVNSAGSGLITHAIKAMINQVDAMLNHHSKIHLIRFDLRMYQHYHYVLMIDGHKVRHPIEILSKAREIWDIHLSGSEFTPKNCYYNLERNNYESIQDAIWRISYLAKARGKGYKPPQTKNYGTSRIKYAT